MAVGIRIPGQNVRKALRSCEVTDTHLKLCDLLEVPVELIGIIPVVYRLNRQIGIRGRFLQLSDLIQHTAASGIVAPEQNITGKKLHVRLDAVKGLQRVLVLFHSFIVVGKVDRVNHRIDVIVRTFGTDDREALLHQSNARAVLAHQIIAFSDVILHDIPANAGLFLPVGLLQRTVIILNGTQIIPLRQIGNSQEIIAAGQHPFVIQLFKDIHCFDGVGKDLVPASQIEIAQGKKMMDPPDDVYVFRSLCFLQYLLELLFASIVSVLCILHNLIDP